MATQLAETIETTLPPIDDGDGGSQVIERDFEAEARKQGWHSEDDWPEGKPRPPRFKTAEEFVADVDAWAATKDKKIDRLMDENGFLKRQVRKLMNADETRYQEALEQARREMREAVKVGDEAEFDRLEKKVEGLRKANDGDYMRGEDPNVELARFRRDNRWFDRGQLPSASREEADAVALFSSLSAQYVAEGLDRQLPPSEFFAKIRAEIEAEVPTVFNGAAAAPKPKPASDVAGVTNRNVGKRAKSGANLPPEAKLTAERYMRNGVFVNGDGSPLKTKEEAYDMMAKNWKGAWA